MTYEKVSVAEDNKNGEPRKSSSVIVRFLPILVILCGLIFAYLAGWHRFFTLEFLATFRNQIALFVSENYVLSLTGFFAAYTLAVAFSFPAASILSIFAGFMFGWFVGGLVVAFGATLGSLLIFLAARFAFADFFREKVGGKLAAMADGFREDAFSYLFVLRLAPIFPFWLINIAPAFFNIPARTYVAATFLGILPGTFAYTYLGQGVESVILAARDAGRDISIGDLVTRDITIAFAALALVAAIPVVVKNIRNRGKN